MSITSSPSEQVISELLSDVLAGQTDAFAEIIRLFNQRMFRIARSIVLDDDEAMDIVQESFIKAYERLGGLNAPGAFGVWLSRIVRNTALMRLRSLRRYLLMDDADLESNLALSAVHPTERMPELELINMQLRRLLEQTIDTLPQPFRVVFVLRAVEECTTAETAAILEINEATVKTRFHRAKRQIRKQILACSEAAGVDAYEFAGARCQTVVYNVMRSLQPGQCGRTRCYPISAVPGLATSAGGG